MFPVPAGPGISALQGWILTSEHFPYRIVKRLRNRLRKGSDPYNRA